MDKGKAFFQDAEITIARARMEMKVEHPNAHKKAQAWATIAVAEAILALAASKEERYGGKE